MQSFQDSSAAASASPRSRTAVVASADRNFRQRLSEILTGLRWQVREAEGGAQVWAEAAAVCPEAIIVDSWLPDLDLGEFLKDMHETYPQVELMTTASLPVQDSPRGPYRQELLYALRRSQDTDTAAWNTAPALAGPIRATGRAGGAAGRAAIPAGGRARRCPRRFPLISARRRK